MRPRQREEKTRTVIAFVLLYMILLGGIVLYGSHRYWLAWGSLRASRRTRAKGLESASDSGECSLSGRKVLIQLPVYNEGEVVAELIRSAIAVDWERDDLQIQVLDDSDDGSEAFAAQAVADARAEGVRIEHLRREDRAGYKAGALKEGLERSDAEFVAIFDADFVIPRDFLRRALPPFADVKVGMVQARWAFSNEEQNLLTRVQAMLLDGHFGVEHKARAAGERFFNFNGTAGVWRVSTIADAGGWKADTITEDLDLSIRAWLGGWKFCYLDDLLVPSVLPEAIPTFKIQQNRWVSGSIQTAKKCLRPIWQSRLRLVEKIDLTFYLTGNCTYLLLFLLALSVPLAVLLRFDRSRATLLLWSDLPFFVLATLSVFVFYGCARGARPMARYFLLRIPALMALGLGMSLHNSRATLRGFLGRSRVFERTPKGHQQEALARPRRRRDPLSWLEPVMAVYLLLPALTGLRAGNFLSLPFLALFVAGFLFVFFQSGRSRSSTG